MLDIVDRRPSILHVTLQTGHTSRSYRQDVSDTTIATLRPLVGADGEYAIPGVSARKLQVTRTGRLLLATIQGDDPICTLAIADRSVGADKLWEMIHERTKAATHRGKPPSAPWCAARLEPGFASCPDEDAAWLADFQRCLAWSFLDSLPRRGSLYAG
jgi:hypothetical protein